MQNMQHQAVCLDLRPLFLDLSLKRGALSSSSSVRTEAAVAPAGLLAAARDERAGLGPAAGPSPPEWPSRRVGGSTPVRARMASACSGGGARRAARGARRAFGASGMQHLSPHPHATPFGLWGGGRPLGWGEAMLC